MEAPSPVPSATNCPPFATPALRPLREASPFPAIVPPTCVPWPEKMYRSFLFQSNQHRRIWLNKSPCLQSTAQGNHSQGDLHQHRYQGLR